MRTKEWTPPIDPADNWTTTYRLQSEEVEIEINDPNFLYAGTGIDGGPKLQTVKAEKITLSSRDNFGYDDDDFSEIESRFRIKGMAPNRKLYRHGSIVGLTCTSFESVYQNEGFYKV